MSFIAHSSSLLGDAEAAAAADCIERNFVGHGPRARALEIEIGHATGRPFAAGVSSGFHALSLAVRALDLAPASVIALPVLTCPSVLAAVVGAGHRPWLVDIRDRDLTLDVAAIPDAAAAVIAPHAYGAPVDVETVERLGKPWIEDCATLPWLGGSAAGKRGTLAVFSFGSTKYLTGASGGMIVARDGGLGDRVDDLLDFDRFEKKGRWCATVPPALPGRLPDLNAAVALAQWRRLPELSARRAQIARIYHARLDGIAELELPPDHGFYRYVVHTTPLAAPLAGQLRRLEIDARTSVNPWLDESGVAFGGGPWPVAAEWKAHLLSLPIHPAMTDSDAERVANSLRQLLGGSI